ncbi:MAG: hypothetical protein OEY56_13700 [Cyclobacteriaceae bacterium]|nr:hypothetical protein [Cyclobacteriaceae bacterium]
MKNLSIFIFSISLFMISCQSGENINPDLMNNYLTIEAGDSHQICYQKLRELYNNEEILNLFVQGNTFETIDNFTEMISLYNEFWIIIKTNGDQRDTINFNFEKDTLETIYNQSEISPLTGGHTSLDIWPDNLQNTDPIMRGDTKSTIAQKLLLLKSTNPFNEILDQVVYTIKDFETGFDSHSAQSELWTILESYDTDFQKQYYFDIHFANGLVKGIAKKEVPRIGLN